MDSDPRPSNSEHSTTIPKREVWYKLLSSSHLPHYKRALLFLGMDRLAGTGMRLDVYSDDMPVSPNVDDTSLVFYNSIV